MKVEVSVIIPVYNAEKYLRTCLDSLSKQSFKDWEVICVNDGSTDKSLDILREYAEKDQRFVVLTQQNSGVYVARNKGLELARGQYVMFMDNDDKMHERCIEWAVKSIQKTDSDMVQFTYKHVGVDEKIEQQVYNDVEVIQIYDKPLETFLQNHDIKTVMIWDKIYKAELAKNVQFAQLHPGEDDLYTFCLLAECQKYARVANELYYYVKNPTSVLQSLTHEKNRKNRLRMAECFAEAMVKICAKTKDSDLQFKLHRYVCEHFLFKEYILKTLRLHEDKKLLQQRLENLQQKMADGIFALRYINFRYRIIYFLVKHRLYLLARIMTM